MKLESGSEEIFHFSHKCIHELPYHGWHKYFPHMKLEHDSIHPFIVLYLFFFPKHVNQVII